MYLNVSQQVATLKDGDCFGELSLVDETAPDESTLFVEVHTSL